MPGPLPSDGAARRNAPTIPTTNLPVTGRVDEPPAVPQWVVLGDAGLAWWDWAWHTPQAAGWDDGVLYFVARRAQLEDDMDALQLVDDAFDLAEMLEIPATELTRRMSSIFKRLKALASNKVAVAKEARELDNRLGLNPKAMAELRWKIVDPEAGARPSRPKAPRGLTAVS